MSVVNTVKIAEYKLRQTGERGVEISLPKVFAKDNNINPGDIVDVHRGIVNGIDALIIIPTQPIAQPSVRG